jgi:putative inorganic carbon (HCO3(-)) transporter
MSPMTSPKTFLRASIAESSMKSADAACLMVVTAVAAAAILGGAFYPGPRIAVGLAFAVGLGLAALSGIGRMAIEERVLFAFLGWAVVTVVVASSAPLAGREVLTTWIVASMIWLVARRVGASAGRVALRIIAGVALVVAAGVALEAAGSRSLRVGGLLENPNLTASLLVVSIPALFAMNRFRRRWLTLLLAAALVVGVVLTGSRAGLLAVLAAVAVAFPRGGTRTLGLGVGVLGATAILVWRFVSQPDILAWFRPSIWAAVLRLWAEHPIVGVGPGGLVDAVGAFRILHADHVGQRQFLIAYAESSPLAVLVQTGMVGLLLVLAAVVLWLRGERSKTALASAPFRAVLAAMAAMAAFHDLITADVVLWWWAAVLGLMEAPHLLGGAPEDAAEGKMGIRTAIAAMTVYVVLWGMVEPSWARWLWRSGKQDVALVDRAVRAEPGYWVPLDWRANQLLASTRWDWETAAEVMARSRVAAGVRPGSGALWGGVALAQARVVSDLGRWPDAVREARKAFSRAAELEPHQPWYWLEWARFERTMGRVDEAVGLARRAVAEEPHAVRAWLFIARLELDRGQMDAARSALSTARASFAMRTRHARNTYERDLLYAPAWQFRQLEEALQ